MPPLTRAQQQAKEALIVRSAPNREGYNCPDIESVDRFLAKLSSSRHATSLTDAGRKRLNEDIDALLSRRHFLLTVGP